MAQQLREATPFGQGPKYLIRNNDNKYGIHFANVAVGAQIQVLTTPLQAPRANAVVERFSGSVRRELCWPIAASSKEQSSGLPRIGMMETAQDEARNDLSAIRWLLNR